MKKLLLSLFCCVVVFCLNAETKTYTYDFSKNTNWVTTKGGSTSVGTGKSSKLNAFYYKATGDAFNAHGSGYFNSGYFIWGSLGAYIELPTFEGEKITKVTAKSSSGCSTNVIVTMVSDKTTLVSALKWATKGKEYSYTIPEEYQSSVLSLQVTNTYNAQTTQIVITTETVGGDEPETPTLEAPTFDKADGYVFYPSFDLTISAEEGATIYYTLDGTDPTEESDEYVEPITISETTTVKAYAVAEGYNSSEITTATYIISQWKTPTFSQADGYVFSSPFDLTISAEAGATIYYTLDGTDPTEESDEYVEPITISETTTVKAYAVAEGRKDSPITTATYTYVDPSNIKQYGLVTSADQLVLGVNYLIACDQYAMGERPSGKNYFNPVAINVSQDGIITILDEAVNPVTLEGESGAWAMKTSLEGKYLYWGSGNNLTTQDTFLEGIENGEKWEISIESGVTKIKNNNPNAEDAGRYLQYNTNSGQERFACYKNTQKNPNLYAELKYVYICDETSKGDVQIISIKDENGEAVTVSALEEGEWTLDLTRAESVVYNKRYGFVPSNGVYTITYQYTKDDVVVTDEREFTPTQDGTISFTDDIITSINGIEVENAPVEYFNLQGVRVANPENGLYIRRQGNKVEKIFLKK